MQTCIDVPEFSTLDSLAIWRGQSVSRREWEIWRGINCTPATTEGLRWLFAVESRAPAPVEIKQLPCLNRGTLPLRREACTTCHGTQIKVFACSIYGECHLSDKQVSSGVRSCVGCADFITSRDLHRQTLSWAIGVTTAGNRGSLSTTLDNLKTAGWRDSLFVFAEPNTAVESVLPPVTLLQSEQQLGAWPNRFRAIKWLVENTESEYILICEDDILVASEARVWIESVGWPSEKCGMLGFYRHAGQTIKNKQGTRWRPADEVCGELDSRGYQQVTGHLWGSCMLAFPRAAAELLVKDNLINREFASKPDRFSDLRLRHWLTRSKLEYWVANPSQCQHRSDVVSILGHGNGPDMSSDTFVGEDFDGAAAEMWPV